MVLTVTWILLLVVYQRHLGTTKLMTSTVWLLSWLYFFFLLQALLSSEPKSSSCSLLKMTMRELIALAMPSADRNTDSSTVPQVWPLNAQTILRVGSDIFLNISNTLDMRFLSHGMYSTAFNPLKPHAGVIVWYSCGCVQLKYFLSLM